MTKKIKIFCLILLLCVLSLLPLSRVHAKYVKELPIGTFNLSITSSEKTFAIYDETDRGLYIYKRQTLPADGQTTYDGKTVSALYTGNLESLEASSSTDMPWSGIAPNIVSVSFEDTIVPVSTSNWFAEFTNCTTFKLDKLDTSKVKDMSYMFTMCATVSTLDLSGFNTGAVKNTAQMFAMCEQLTTIYASKDFVMDNVEDSSDMFPDTKALVGGEGTPWDEEITDKTYARIDGLNGEKGYFTYSGYTLAFDAVDGVGAPNILFSETNTFTIPNQIPTFEDANFLGWITSSESTLYQAGDTFTSSNEATPSKDKLYAVFDIVTTKAALKYAQDSGKSFIVQGGTYSKIAASGEDVVVTIRDSSISGELSTPELNGTFGPIGASNGATVIVENLDVLEPSGSWGVVRVDTNATIIIRGGHYVRASMLWGGDGTGTLRIEGGIFEVDGFTGMVSSGTTNVVITGGTFKADPSAYVDTAGGYVATKNADGTWTVAKAA